MRPFFFCHAYLKYTNSGVISVLRYGSSGRALAFLASTSAAKNKIKLKKNVSFD
jgi:hypothetical protein